MSTLRRADDLPRLASPYALAALLLSLCFPSRAQAGDPTHPFTVLDLVAFDRLAEPVVSPDGKRVVYTVSALDLDANKRRTDVYLLDLAGGGAPRRLTSPEAQDGSPAWSPDGRHLYFLSTRSGSAQVYRVPSEGGEAEQVTKLPLEVGSFRLSPDGTKLAVALEVYPSCADLECTTSRLSERASRKSTAQVYDQLFIRHWDAWADGRRSHLFLVPVAGGKPIDLMKGIEADCPTKPFGNDDEYTFTPDGKGIVYSAHVPGRDEAWSTNYDLYYVPLDGSAAPRALTTANKAWDTHPIFSPDGGTLCYLATTRPGYESDRRRIRLRDVSAGWDGPERELAADWDRSPDDLVFAPDGKTLLTSAEHLGHKALFAIDVDSGKARVLVGEGHATAPRPAGDRVVFLLGNLRAPAELYSVKLDGRELRALTRTNAARLSSVRMGQAEQFTFVGANNDKVHGWLVRPADFDPKKKYPIAFLIHGGPQGSFGNEFHYRWNPQAYAGAGYAALMIDFHGSTGYGQAFTDSVQDDWGGKPLTDLQKGLEAALARYPFLDGDRACALGASFGGYMVNWIAGNWTDRFKCLVAHDGNLDERMAYFDTEELWFPEWEHRGAPWEGPTHYFKHNPIDFVDRWKTPMLVIHGGKDYRVAETQGMSTFTALQRRAIPSRFLYFPDENHWVLKPHNSIVWHQTVLEWLDRWTKPRVAGTAR